MKKWMKIAIIIGFILFGFSLLRINGCDSGCETKGYHGVYFFGKSIVVPEIVSQRNEENEAMKKINLNLPIFCPAICLKTWRIDIGFFGIYTIVVLLFLLIHKILKQKFK